MKNKKTKIGLVPMTLVISITLFMSIIPTVPAEGINPEEITVGLYPGESYELEKTVTTPAIPPVLDLLLLEDETGSFSDDIALMKGTASDCSNGLAAAMWDGIAAEVDDFQGAVAGFRDFAQSPSTYPPGPPYPWGNPGDWVYRLLQDFTTDKDTWLTGICGLTAGGGWDGPESQLGALKTAADGSTWDSNGDGDLADPEDTPADQDPTWRDDATKVVVLVTDAPYHVNGDSGGWPGPTYADTVDALNDAGIHVVILSTYTGWYTSLATDTGGSTETISSNSADIVEAVLDALEEVTTDVWWVANCEDGITVELDPAVYYDVPGETELTFTETISVADDTESGIYTCTVDFYSNTYPEEGSLIGTQTITVKVFKVVDLIAGQYYDVGDVYIWNDEDFLYIKYVTTDDWYITETHLHVADSLEGIPQKNGNPIPGKFDYSEDHDPAVQSYLYVIPWDPEWLPGETNLYIAAHAVVQKIIGYDEDGNPIYQIETAWGDGLDFPGKNWATYIVYIDP